MEFESDRYGRPWMSTGDPADRDPEGMMLAGLSDDDLTTQLLRLSREPDLRLAVYERLGEYCHQCRNRLNSLKLSLYLLMRQSTESGRGHWTEVDRRYQELERRVDRIQTICRPMTLTRVTLGLDLLIEDRREAWTRSATRRGWSLEIIAPASRAVASFDVERFGQALDALVEWRTGEGAPGSLARLRWWVEAGHANLAWEEPSWRPDRGPDWSSNEGATWTLPLLTRVATAHGGDLRLQDDRGWRLVVSWPSLPPTP